MAAQTLPASGAAVTFNTQRTRAYLLKLPLFTRATVLIIVLTWVLTLVGKSWDWDVKTWGALIPDEIGIATCRSFSNSWSFDLGFARDWLGWRISLWRMGWDGMGRKQQAQANESGRNHHAMNPHLCGKHAPGVDIRRQLFGMERGFIIWNGLCGFGPRLLARTPANTHDNSIPHQHIPLHPPEHLSRST